ncbi:MAG: choline dehydrogenase [Gammaproteobacteria bacterium]|nr:choline dehydrogenase [Gammaproteobacteria bacterium]MDH3466530.1 choline dehydrogenase [Gammaproteobacteria bacterium]
MKSKTYDYIIIGAGSAGCVLANRLTEDGSKQVLLVEAGGSDRHIFIQMPTAFSFPMNMKRFNWYFESEPEIHLNNRSLHCPRGKALGGSSAINGMVYVRGHACDFDEWESSGAEGWGYRNCLPYFKRAETWMNKEDEYRGGNGPLGICNGNNMRLNPLYRAFINAGVDAGYPETQDYNGHQQEGFGPMHMTVNNGVRASTSEAYLRPVMSRSNLEVVTHTLTRKILLEGKRAVGVELEESDKIHTVMANDEVILCAGSIGSPQLLMLSGIGPKDVLAKAGVELTHELPGVGENLQDHLEVYFQYRCTKPITLNSKLGLISRGLIGIRWILFKTGLGATNHFESCAFIRSRANLKWPNIQFHFLPAAMRYDGKKAFDGHGFQVHVGPNKPSSRGYVRIGSADVKDKPEIRFNYLEHEQDRIDWRACIRLTREILKQPALDDYRGDEIQPGSDVTTDREIDEWVKNNVESAYHPSCTCKMGAETDSLAVVDPLCRVIGIENLRIADSSIFPSITNGNLNAPSIMVGEKAADIILGKKPLSESNAAVWIDDEWERRQRPNPPKRVV